MVADIVRKLATFMLFAISLILLVVIVSVTYSNYFGTPPLEREIAQQRETATPSPTPQRAAPGAPPAGAAKREPTTAERLRNEKDMPIEERVRAVAESILAETSRPAPKEAGKSRRLPETRSFIGRVEEGGLPVAAVIEPGLDTLRRQLLAPPDQQPIPEYEAAAAAKTFPDFSKYPSAPKPDKDGPRDFGSQQRTVPRRAE